MKHLATANRFLGTRIRILRKRGKLTQEALAEALGFNDRQTVSAIENGRRRVTAEELLRLTEVLGVPLESLTDPLQLDGEGAFSWRCANDTKTACLEDYQQQAGRWVAAFRTLAPEVGRPLRLVQWKLGLRRDADCESAMLAGEQFAKEFRLGSAPALRLAEAMERKLGMLVLAFDARPRDGISGAACHLPDLHAALIVRREPAERRHYTLARELFHLLTWDVMPPNHRESTDAPRGRRAERLADRFAGAVLMPAAALHRRCDWNELSRPELLRQINAAADELHVAADALRRRLVSLGLLRRSTARELPEPALRHNRRRPEDAAPPALFSEPFMSVIERAIRRGRISVRRAARLLELTIDDLAELFPEHGLSCPFDL